MLKCMDSIDYSQKNMTGSVTMLNVILHNIESKRVYNLKIKVTIQCSLTDIFVNTRWILSCHELHDLKGQEMHNVNT